MSLNRAIKFINQASVDDELRTKLNTAVDNNARKSILKDYDLLFNYPEFEDAYNNMLCNCQTEDQASDLQNFKLWWDYLSNS